ncbi:hypothetical protein EYF80_044956 [Liparis tanakae]|uniref:Uncharacterized protein n=1 Tax=Liparis tanakae TaxID=230148 RepID=A0A4Z2FUC8_9TELE|nr:hypothetical protein EYF80_044956 [Liparis tanakae]
MAWGEWRRRAALLHTDGRQRSQLVIDSAMCCPSSCCSSPPLSGGGPTHKPESRPAAPQRRGAALGWWWSASQRVGGGLSSRRAYLFLRGWLWLLGALSAPYCTCKNKQRFGQRQSAKSQTTQAPSHIRAAGAGSPQEDIKGAAEEQTRPTLSGAELCSCLISVHLQRCRHGTVLR